MSPVRTRSPAQFLIKNKHLQKSLPARVAQLVERQPSKLNVAGSNPVSRSKTETLRFGFFIISNLVLLIK
ncbi:hypothetical protein T190115A13A_40178 [Tenacibaculum sp. 190524A02b]|uniref:Uncharacterized protein n=1 Tax=Tenacibaculum vairaonense TaxID=3137860 RepID=A0ABM9PPI6_9FLAO